MNIAIIGTGYVGLTTGACLADLGHRVICVDNDLKKVEKLKRAETPIYEPGLEELVKKNFNNNLTFSSQITPAAKNSQVIFICVNTPPRQDGQADLKYVERVAREIAEVIDNYTVIVDKSTVPIKTAEKVKETIKRYNKRGIDFDVVSNPEFLREGSAVEDTMNPDRIVIGVDNGKAREIMLEVYKPLIERTQTPVKIVSVRSAELIKHGANTFLAAKISFANLIAQVCEHAEADALEVLESIGLDKRIGQNHLYPGIGFGGSCFPKDIAAFKKTLEILGIEPTLIESIERINESAWQRFVHKIERELWVLDGKTIGVLGLAFKPNTDDIRNAPAINIIQRLLADGVNIKAYDPKAMEKAKQVMPDIEYCENPYQVAQNCDALIICTDWNEFQNLDYDKIKELMITPIIFDGRNILDAQKIKELGFKYFGVGK